MPALSVCVESRRRLDRLNNESSWLRLCFCRRRRRSAMSAYRSHSRHGRLLMR